MGNGALFVGSVLLLLAVAHFLADAPAREPCRRFCFAYDLVAHYFGFQFANAAGGAMYFVVGILFLVAGVRARRKAE